MFSQRDIVDALKERGIKGKFKTMFGGAGTTREWIKQIGADGWAENGADAVTEARKLLG
jgi:methanogenic corrinoid protein MtbC1